MRMPDTTHPTRQTLLDAGLTLAEQTALSAMSVDELVREAGVAKGTFYVHFTDRAEYLSALHRQFHDQLRETIAIAVGDLPSGSDRLRRATVAYLDGCLVAKGVKAMLAQARGLPAISREVSEANDRFARGARRDFDALGFTNPLDSARLFVTMTAEVALLELEAGRRRPKLRAALLEYVGSAGRREPSTSPSRASSP
jgi:Bacterial regulatory proteins, tetR family.